MGDLIRHGNKPQPKASPHLQYTLWKTDGKQNRHETHKRAHPRYKTSRRNNPAG